MFKPGPVEVSYRCTQCGKTEKAVSPKNAPTCCKIAMVAFSVRTILPSKDGDEKGCIEAVRSQCSFTS